MAKRKDSISPGANEGKSQIPSVPTAPPAPVAPPAPMAPPAPKASRQQATTPSSIFNPNVVAINEPWEPLTVVGMDAESQAIADEIMSQEEEERLAAEAESRFNNEVGERLRHVREVLGMTVTSVANRLNVTRQTLSNYESGRTPLRASVIRELAEIYSISCDWILGAEDNIEINVSSSDGRSLYMRESSPRLYPASVKTNADKDAWDQAWRDKHIDPVTGYPYEMSDF